MFVLALACTYFPVFLDDKNLKEKEALRPCLNMKLTRPAGILQSIKMNRPEMYIDVAQNCSATQVLESDKIKLATVTQS